MKNNILKRTVIVLGFAGLISCSDSFLDVDPITDMTENSFYLNEKDADRALVGCYDGVKAAWDAEATALPFVAEILSDNCFGGTGKTDGRKYKMLNSQNKDFDPGNVNLFNDTWVNYYAAIFRINKLIQKVGSIELKEDAAKRIEGEARFLRANCYFDMARLWGNIVLKLEPVDTNEPQASPEEVYKAIATDLKWAADNMSKDPWTVAWATTNDGHATSWAAKALLGRVFLYYTGYYGKTSLPLNDGELTKAQVLVYLEDVVQNSGHDLVPEYKNLWLSTSYKIGRGEKKGESGTSIDILVPDTYAGEGNIETVFAIKHNNTGNWDNNIGSNRWLTMLGVRGAASGFPYGQGWGGAPVNPRLVAAFGNDPRKELSVIDVAKELPGTANFNLSEHIADMQEYTGYMNKKYTPLNNPDGTSYAEYISPYTNASFMISQSQDYTVIRYADVLLMAAELGSGNAQSYFDQVRNRAYAPNPAPARSATLANILEERRLEFAFEGLRYWDVLRQGIEQAASILEISENGVVTKTGGIDDIVSVSSSKIRGTKGLQQIPADQITLSNGVIVQNQGW